MSSMEGLWTLKRSTEEDGRGPPDGQAGAVEHASEGVGDLAPGVVRKVHKLPGPKQGGRGAGTSMVIYAD